MNLTFSKNALPKTGVVVFAVFDGKDMSGIKGGKAFAAADKTSRGALAKAAKAAGFTGKKGQLKELFAVHGTLSDTVLLVGAGKANDLTGKAAEELGGNVVAKYFKSGAKAVTFALTGFAGGDLDNATAASHVAIGARLRGYAFDSYRTKAEKSQLQSLKKITINLEEMNEARAAFADHDKIIDGVFLTRDLVSEPPNVLYPESFAERCRELETLGVKVEILGEKQMTKLGMGALLGVGQGSRRDSRLVVMKWMGGKKDEKPVCFIGKGVTFDTGGISLKPGAGMEEMKFDMGGAGAVTGAMCALAGRKAKANVIGLIGLVENMPDGNAQRPGDVVTTMSGQTVEILNTDAEGRLVLGDVLTYTQEKYNPACMVDLATLTGAIIIALAHEHAGVFSMTDEIADMLISSGESVNEGVWRMPLTKTHLEMIKSDIADMKNMGPGRAGGSSTAAAYLKRFVDDKMPWAHLDIAGTAWAYKDTPTCPKGGSGYGVRLLDQFVRDNYEGDA